MKFLTSLLAVAAIVGITFLTFLDRVPTGHVGIKVDLLGSEKGVGHEELGVGRYFIGWNEELHLFPTFSQNVVWSAPETEGGTDESLTFQSREGLDIGADVGMTYLVDAERVSVLFERYRRGITEITDVYLRNMVRDALVAEASKMRVESIYGEGKAEMLARAEARVREQVASHGIIVERIYWIGKLRLPVQVITAINDEIAANSKARQRANEVAASEAEAEKLRKKAAGEADQITAIADAQAAANRKLAASLTPELVEYLKTEKWDGALPTVTGGSTPMISLK